MDMRYTTMPVDGVTLASYSKALLPRPQHTGDAGIDLRCASAFYLEPGETMQIGTGVVVDNIDRYIVGMVCSRSGLAAHDGVHVLNAPGIIDSMYRGEIAVILHNASSHRCVVEAGRRIAQLVFTPVCPTVAPVQDTDRGEGGLGSTDSINPREYAVPQHYVIGDAFDGHDDGADDAANLFEADDELLSDEDREIADLLLGDGDDMLTDDLPSDMDDLVDKVTTLIFKAAAANLNDDGTIPDDNAGSDDVVSHPKHYAANRDFPGLEAILFTRTMRFGHGNAVKYLWRHAYKGRPVEDLRKARWYLVNSIEGGSQLLHLKNAPDNADNERELLDRMDYMNYMYIECIGGRGNKHEALKDVAKLLAYRVMVGLIFYGEEYAALLRGHSLLGGDTEAMSETQLIRILDCAIDVYTTLEE
ncbi:deoxyuridine triphosphatase [Corynebacterium phage EmiRose]|uniref:dUTP diphosphatase n=1 Tax=Corynebacterium phage EmiRose TaxID=2565372 RepID=A0A649VNX0_9CAUD|nr:deoxyuridine triphosphatase [Corynebacterium phage EmiRose]QGJ94160.1 deoxyuridine triphosphatase [Corynebacterium phage EmiRose]